MKKTLLALSLAALPVAAFAEVTVYGQISAGVESKRSTSTSYEIQDLSGEAGDVVLLEEGKGGEAPAAVASPETAPPPAGTPAAKGEPGMADTTGEKGPKPAAAPMAVTAAPAEGQGGAVVLEGFDVEIPFSVALVTTKERFRHGLRDTGSYFGLRGKESLGGGLNAIWQIEQDVSVNGASNGWANRDSFLGLQGEFGQVRVGNLSSPLKDADTLDQWTYSDDALGLAHFTRETTVNNRAIGVRYDTPSVAGISGSLFLSPRSNQPNVEGQDAASKQAQLGLSLNYSGNNGLFARYASGFKSNAYQVRGKGRRGAQHLIEFGYEANNLFVGLGFQYAKGVDLDEKRELTAQEEKEWAEFRKQFEVVDGTENMSSLPEGFSVTEPETKEMKAEAMTAAAEAGEGGQALGDEFQISFDADDLMVVPVRREAVLSVAYTAGNITPKLTYAHGFNVKNAVSGSNFEKTGYKHLIIGADYALSKRTVANVQAGWLRQNDGRDVRTTTTAFGFGLSHKF